MDIKHLQYFIEVAAHNSFTRAADHLFVTQPTISKMIKNLEEELGVELFDRSGKKLTMTDAGRVVYEQALLINKSFNNLETEMENLLGLKTGHIRIGLPPIIDPVFFPEMIGKFHEKYPDITFQLLEDGSKKIEDAVEQDKVDIGIIVLPANEDLFRSKPLFKEDLKLVLQADHPLAGRDAVSLADLKNEPFILFNEDYILREMVISSCRKAGFSPKIISQSSRWDFIEAMVACRLGLSILPESITKQMGSRVTALSILDSDLTWTLGVIWRKDQYLSYAAKEWLRFLVDYEPKQ